MPKPIGRPSKRPAHARDAKRRAYVSYIAGSSIAEAARVAGVPRERVARWVAEESWHRERELVWQEEREELRTDLAETVIADRPRIVAIARAAIQRWLQALQAGQIRLATTGDLKRLVETYFLAAGEATSVVEVRSPWDQFLESVAQGRAAGATIDAEDHTEGVRDDASADESTDGVSGGSSAGTGPGPAG